MIPDRRRRRVRGLLAQLTWPLRENRPRNLWTEQDQTAFEVWADVKRETP